MNDVDVQCVRVSAHPAGVFELMADPVNLPRWVVGFAKSVEAAEDGAVIFVTGSGDRIPVQVRSDAGSGVIDFVMNPAADGAATAWGPCRAHGRRRHRHLRPGPAARDAGRDVRRPDRCRHPRAGGAEGGGRGLVPPLTIHPVLVERARGGDRRALGEVLEGLRPVVHRLAVSMLWDGNDAEDATQEILIKAARWWNRRI